jgi:DNA-directed RNA polymerase subunit RPC12/RpoP
VLLAAFVTCASCGTEYLGGWVIDAETPEEADEPMQGAQRCPECGHEQDEEFPGWSFRTEPG